MKRTPTKCRAIIRAKDGKRYLTRWFAWKAFEELGPDEQSTWHKVNLAAKAMVKRRGLDAVSIDAQFVYPRDASLNQQDTQK